MEVFNATFLRGTNALQTLLILSWKNQDALLMIITLVILIKASYAITLALLNGAIFQPQISTGATLIQLIDLCVKIWMKDIILPIMDFLFWVKVKHKIYRDIIAYQLMPINVTKIITIYATQAIFPTVQQVMESLLFP